MTAAVEEGRFVVGAELGLHALPASQFVALAGCFEADIRVGRGDEWVDGRSILSLLSLAASKGTTLVVQAEGADAREAIEALGALLESVETSAALARAGGAQRSLIRTLLVVGLALGAATLWLALRRFRDVPEAAIAYRYAGVLLANLVGLSVGIMFLSYSHHLNFWIMNSTTR